MNKTQIQTLTRLGLLTALTIILAATPLGYIPLSPALSLTIMTVPIAVGALAIKPYAAIILSAVFGITSFIRAPLEPLSALMLQESLIYTILIVIVGRLLVGVIICLVSTAINKGNKGSLFIYAAVGALAALLNTVIFLSGLAFLFSDIVSNMPGKSGFIAIVVAFAPSAVGEAIAGAVLTMPLVKLLKR